MGSARIVDCLNPHSFVTALEDADFRNALERCDFLLPDGEGIRISLKRWKGIEICKIAGDDLHKHLLSQLQARNGKAYYMGSSDKVLGLIRNRLANEYPNIEIRCFSPSFGEAIPDDESKAILDDIRAFKPDVLFVSMTAPKQEKWAEKYRAELEGVGIVACIGAVFDFYAGTKKRAPKWAIKMKLEWLVRLLKEPRRMWSRNFVSTPRYLAWVKHHSNEM